MQPTIGPSTPTTLLPPTLFHDPQLSPLEYSIHKPTRLLKKELSNILIEVKNKIEDLLIILVFQPTKCDLLTFGDEERIEKDKLLENVRNLAL
jgi:hypothetical protein